MIEVQAIALTKVSVVYGSTYSSDSLNRKAVESPRGIRRGFDFEIGVGDRELILNPDPIQGDSLLAVQGSDLTVSDPSRYALTYRETSAVTLDLSALALSTDYYIVVEHGYSIGLTEPKYNAYTQAEYDAGDAASGVVLGRVTTPGVAGPLASVTQEHAEYAEQWVSAHGQTRFRTIWSYDFDTALNPADWSVQDLAEPSTWTVDLTEKRYGVSSWKWENLTGNQSQRGVDFPNWIRVYPGQRLRFSQYIKGVGASFTSSNVGANVFFFEQDLSLAGTELIDFGPKAAAFDWELHSAEIDVPADAAYVFIQLLAFWTNGSLYFDQLRVQCERLASDGSAWFNDGPVEGLYTTDVLEQRYRATLSDRPYSLAAPVAEVDVLALTRGVESTFRLGSNTRDMNLEIRGDLDVIGDYSTNYWRAIDVRNSLVAGDTIFKLQIDTEDSGNEGEAAHWRVESWDVNASTQHLFPVRVYSTLTDRFKIGSDFIAVLGSDVGPGLDPHIRMESRRADGSGRKYGELQGWRWNGASQVLTAQAGFEYETATSAQWRVALNESLVDVFVLSSNGLLTLGSSSAMDVRSNDFLACAGSTSDAVGIRVSNAESTSLNDRRKSRLDFGAQTVGAVQYTGVRLESSRDSVVANDLSSKFKILLNSHLDTDLSLEPDVEHTFFSDGSLLMSTGGECNTSGDWIDASDFSLKEDIRPIAHGLDELLKLVPKSFRYKTDKPEWNRRLGFVAQEVQGIVDEIVHESKRGEGVLALDVKSLIPVLVKALQELELRVKAIEG